MINSISEEEFNDKIEVLSSKIFSVNNIYMRPLQTTLEFRRILFPCWDDITDALSLESVIQASHSVGDNACYIINPKGYQNGEAGCLHVPLSELIEAYAGEADSPQLIGNLFNINPYYPGTRFVSESGQWGIMTAIGTPLAVMGGCEKFGQVIKQQEINVDNQVVRMISEYFKLENDLKLLADSTDSWFLELLINVYGSVKARSILRETGLLDILGVKLELLN